MLSVAGALALLSVAAALALPTLAEGLARREVQRLASRLKGEVGIEGLAVEGPGGARVARVRWVDGDDFEALVEDVRVQVDPFALLVGGRPLRRVEAGRAEVRLGSAAHPLGGPAGALRRLKALRADGGDGGEDGAGGATGSPRWGRLPDLAVASLSGVAVLQDGAQARVTGGRLDLGSDRAAAMAGRRRLAARLDLDAGDGQPRQLALELVLDPEGPASAEARVVPAFPVPLPAGTLAVGGLAWVPGEASLLDPAWSHPDRGSARAERVTARWREDAAAQAPEWLRHLPAGLVPAARRLVAGRTLVELEVLRPSVDMVVADPPPAEPAPLAAAATATARGGARADGDGPPAAQLRLRGAFQAAAARLDDLGAALEATARRLPGVRIAVHGATVRTLEPGATAARPGQSLVNLEASFRAAEDGTRVAQLSFECPEAPAGANEARLTLDPATGTLTAVLKAAYVPLHPWRPLLPRVLQTSEAVLRQADGRLVLDPRGRRLTGAGTTRVTDLRVDLPAVASSPLALRDFSLAGSVDLDWGRGSLDIPDGRATLGRLAAPFSLRASDLRDRPRVWLKGEVERLPAQDLLDSLPRQVVASLDGVRLGGTFAASVDLAVDTGNLEAVKLDIRPDVADVRTLSMGPAVDLDLLRSVFLHRIEEGDGTVVNRLVGEDTPQWVPLASVPRYLVDALTTAEDATFFQHKGFSPVGIRRSLKVNLQRGGFFQGASTLSQQLVKNLFLSREKTLSRKLQEVFLTWQMEQTLEKEKILELYLNVIEWGPETWGLREAAGHYFAKKPEELSLLESVWLVAVIPAPRPFHEALLAGEVPATYARRARALLAEMGRRNLVPADDVAAALESEVRFAPLVPAAAPAPDGPAGEEGPVDEAAEGLPEDEFTE